LQDPWHCKLATLGTTYPLCLSGFKVHARNVRRFIAVHLTITPTVHSEERPPRCHSPVG
jgi:hypothetical protein